MSLSTQIFSAHSSTAQTLSSSTTSTDPKKIQMSEMDSLTTSSGSKRIKLTKENLEPKDNFAGLPEPLQKTGCRSCQPYIGCNEENQSGMLQLAAVNSRIGPENRVHLGFSVWFNFDLMSVTKPAFGIICDVDDHVIDIYSGIQQCILESPDALTFVDKFRNFLIENAESFFAGLPPGEIKKLFDIDAELVRPGSWLQTPEKFQAIKALHEDGRIRYLNLDITDKNGVFTGIATWMSSNKLELDTLYTSNIIEWLQSETPRTSYLKNLQGICSVNTRFMQAYKPDPHVRGGPVLEFGIGPDAVRIPEQKSLKHRRRAPVPRIMPPLAGVINQLFDV